MLRRRRGPLPWASERRSSRVLSELWDSKSRERPDLQQVRVLDEERGAQVQRDDAHDEPTGRYPRRTRRGWWASTTRCASGCRWTARVGTAGVQSRSSADGRGRRSDVRRRRCRGSNGRWARCTEPLEGNDRRRCAAERGRSPGAARWWRWWNGHGRASSSDGCGTASRIRSRSITAASVRLSEPSERARRNGRIHGRSGTGSEHRGPGGGSAARRRSQWLRWSASWWRRRNVCASSATRR